MFAALRAAGFDIEVRNHAEAILAVDFREQTAELCGALLALRLEAGELIASGGGEAPFTQRLRRDLDARGWRKHNFRIETLVDGRPLGDGISHEIDHIRTAAQGRLALEIEWNNKDPFFDRDLETFQRLHAQSIISAGMIVTRGASLQLALPEIVEQGLRSRDVRSEEDLLPLGMKERTARQRAFVAQRVASGESFAGAFAHVFVADKFGPSTTHWAKLRDRVRRGVGSPCPLLLIGLPAGIVSGYSAASEEL